MSDWYETNISNANVDYITCDSTGQFCAIIVEVSSGSKLWMSYNYGVSWTQQNYSFTSPSGIAMSSGGSKIVSANFDSGPIVLGISDYYNGIYNYQWIPINVNYSPSLNGQSWNQFCMSADGKYMAATLYGYGAQLQQPSYVYQSNDGGSSWYNTSSSLPTTTYSWQFIAMNSTGQYIYVCAYGPGSGTGIYYTSNNGISWQQCAGVENIQGWNSINCSSSGEFVYAVNNSLMYKSSDYGANWVQVTNVPVVADSIYISIAVNGVGNKIYLALRPGFIYVNDNYGNGTWSEIYNISSVNWYTLASSTNDSLLIGGSFNNSSGGSIYSLKQVPSTGFIAKDLGDLSSIFLPIDWQVTTAPSIPWLSITSNSTGQYLFAGASQGQIYYSSNYGNTWTVGTLAGGVNVPTGPWDITCDSSGQYVVATTTEIVIPPLPAPPYSEGAIYYSVNYGATFSKSSQTSPNNTIWGAIKSNGDGSIIVAGAFVGGIYTSSNYNYGDTWTQTSAPDKNWASIASDNTGQYLAAVVGGGGIPGNIYTSNDSGSTWTQTSAPIKDWISITSDSTGQYLAAAVLNEGIYTSSNYGSTWTQTSAPTGGWSSITSDSTGQYLAAVSIYYPLYKSSDYGSTWFSQGDIKNFASIASSADGLKLASATNNAGTSGNVFILNQVNRTNFVAINKNDLSELFQPQTIDPGPNSTVTGFQVNNYTPLWTNVSTLYDLGKLFSVIPTMPIYTATGAHTETISDGYYTVIFTTIGTITFNYSVNNLQVIIVGGGGGGGKNQATNQAGGGGGGGQAIIPFTTTSLQTLTFTINDMGRGGQAGIETIPGFPGTNTILIDPWGANYTVTGGGGGGPSANSIAAGGDYTGTSNTSQGESVLSGTGGDGGYANGNFNESTPGDPSFLLFSSSPLLNLALFGGGGGGSGGTGAEGGGRNGNGAGGFPSNSLNLNTQDANGYGGGGGAGGSYVAGDGFQGVCIFYFRYP
jgi:hypothetical protein